MYAPLLTHSAILLSCLLLCQLVTSHAAPVSRHRRASSNPITNSKTKLSIAIEDSPLTDDIAAGHAKSLFRNKRSTLDEEVDSLLLEQGIHAPTASRRSRRSMAMYLLAASLHLCNKYPHTCSYIEIDDHGARMLINLQLE